MTAKLWAIVPAAGVGKRVGGNVPKQYLPVHDRPIIRWTIDRLQQVEGLHKVVVAISSEDEYWPDLDVDFRSNIKMIEGGAERCYTVLNALQSIENEAAETDWVLVHDAARPCVRVDDINKLVSACQQQQTGGILAVPVRDTMKKSGSDQRIVDTLDRSTMWHALTPQCFRYAELRQALESALSGGFEVTDEASAMEHSGQQPILVQGHSDNIKVTLPEDLQLAAYYLQQQNS